MKTKLLVAVALLGIAGASQVGNDRTDGQWTRVLRASISHWLYAFALIAFALGAVFAFGLPLVTA